MDDGGGGDDDDCDDADTATAQSLIMAEGPWAIVLSGEAPAVAIVDCDSFPLGALGVTTVGGIAIVDEATLVAHAEWHEAQWEIASWRSWKWVSRGAAAVWASVREFVPW